MDVSTNPTSPASAKTLLESRVAADILVPLDSEKRLSVLESLNALDAPSERVFQTLTELANQLLQANVALITLVTNDRQFFISSNGLSEPWESRRETGLSHSFCQHVVTRNQPLVINDAKGHALVCENLAIEDLNVAAYLGVPLIYEDGTVLGAFCVIDAQSRKWTSDELAVLSKFAATAAAELAVRNEEKRKQLQLENQLRHAQKMEAIGNFTSGIAHDFNNILSGIQLNSDVLEAAIDSKELMIDSVGRIQDAVVSAKKIIEQLLHWSTPTNVKMEWVSLPQLVHDTLPLLTACLPSSIKIEHRFADIDESVLVDSTQIQQVILNLVSNAEFAMREQGGVIRLSIEAVTLESKTAAALDLQTGNFVRLKISDEGTGIPNELLHRIHDPYFTTKLQGEGSGLGLWTTFGIVRAHEARITVESTPNHGTSFEIFFPSVNVQNECAKKASVETGQESLEIVCP